MLYVYIFFCFNIRPELPKNFIQLKIKLQMEKVQSYLQDQTRSSGRSLEDYLNLNFGIQ